MDAWNSDLSRVAETVASLPSSGLDKVVAQMASAVTVMPEMQVPKLVADGTLGAVAEVAESLRLTESRYAAQLSEWSSALSRYQNEISQVAGAVAAVSSVKVPRLVGTTLAAVSDAMEASGTSQITGAFDGVVSAARSTLAPLQDFASQTADLAAAVAQVRVPDILSEEVRATIAGAAEALGTSSLVAAFDGAASAARSSLAPLQGVASQAADLAATLAQMEVPDILGEEARATFAKTPWELDTSALATALDNVGSFREQFKAANPFDAPTGHSISTASAVFQELIEDADQTPSDTEEQEHHGRPTEPDDFEPQHDQIAVAQAVLLILSVVAVTAIAYKSLDAIALACGELLEATMFLGSLTSALYVRLSEILPDDNVVGWVAALVSMIRGAKEGEGGRT